MPDVHLHAPGGDENSSGTSRAEGHSRDPSTFPETAPLDTFPAYRSWVEYQRDHPYDHCLMPAEEAAREPEYELASFHRYVDFMWNRYGEPIWRAAYEKSQDPEAASRITLTHLLFAHPGDRAADFIQSHGVDLRGAERARTVLYRQFYTWAFANEHCAFNPTKLAAATAFLAMVPGSAPENRILNAFFEFMAAPKDGGFVPGAGLDRKIAQQLTRQAIRLADFLWTREIEAMQAAGIEPSSLTKLQQAERIEAALLNFTPKTLQEFLAASEAEQGSNARDRASSAVKSRLLPFIAEKFGGQSREVFEAARSPFPNFEFPETEVHLKYRAHLLQLSGLTPDDPRYISPGTAHNRDYLLRAYGRFTWENYGRGQSGNPEAILDSLLRNEPHERIQAFIKHFTAGDPKTDDIARVRLEKATSALRLFYQWAVSAGLTTYDYDSPQGVDSWFRYPLPDGVPALPAYDGFCDFLGAEVNLRTQTGAAGIDEGTAGNYRRRAAKLVTFAWDNFKSRAEHVSKPPEETSAGFIGSFAEHARGYAEAYFARLKSEAISENMLRGARSAIQGIFLPWLEGRLVHIGGGRTQARVKHDAPEAAAEGNSTVAKSLVNRPRLMPLTIPPERQAPLTPKSIDSLSPQATATPGQHRPATIATSPTSPAVITERRVLISDPRTTAMLLRSRNMAIDAMLGRGRGIGTVTFGELCMLKMHEYDEAKGLLIVYREKGGRTAVFLDEDCKPMVNEYVRQVRNVRPFLKAALAAAREAPLFMSADGGTLAVNNAKDPIDSSPIMKTVSTLRDTLLTALSRQTELRFEDAIELPPPTGFDNRAGHILFRQGRLAASGIAVSVDLMRRCKEYLDSVRLTKIAERWDSLGVRNYFFPGNDGGKLTGDE